MPCLRLASGRDVQTLPMEDLLKLIVWLSASCLLYVYLGYPILVSILAAFRARPENPPDSVEPNVSLLISAYNEAAVIASKIENSLALHYPQDRLEIVVISDCSDDRTDEIVQRYADKRVRLIRQNRR